MPHGFCQGVANESSQNISAPAWWKGNSNVDGAIRKIAGSVCSLRRRAKQAQPEYGKCKRAGQMRQGKATQARGMHGVSAKKGCDDSSYLRCRWWLCQSIA